MAANERGQANTDHKPRADYRPQGGDRKTGLFATLKRTFTEFSEDNLTDWAAALTYYGVLSLFPALIAMVSIVGLVGDPASTTKTLTDIVTKLGPASAAETLAGPINSITSNSGAAGVALIAGLAAALWSASGYVGASCGPRTSSTRRPRAGPSGSYGPCRAWSR